MSVLKAQIRTVDINGKPTNTILATSNSIALSEITRDTFYYFTFPSSVSVIPNNQQYALVLLLDDTEYYYSDTNIAGWAYSNVSNQYPDGNKWKYESGDWVSSDYIDQYFKVFYDAPQESTLIEHTWQFNQDYGNKFFISTDNTMELDMRFNLSFCIDGSGSMNWADPYGLRTSETLLFIREIMRRAPFSYVDIWTYSNYINELTYDGPTRSVQDYSAALGSINSDGDESRLWAATEQAVGNLDPSSIVSAITRDSYTNSVMELMRQMNRIDYDEMHNLNNNYDASTGFNGLFSFQDLIDYIIYDYASTMGSVGIIMSDGYDNDTISDDYDIDDIILTANAIREEKWTPLYCFALGSNYKNEQMYQITQSTNGLMYQIGDEISTRLRESFGELLNNKNKTIFQGIYEDEIWFDELTFLSAIELGVIIPATSDAKFEISVSYDGLTFEDWQELPCNAMNTVEKFINAFKIRITGWLGNIYGGNYYDIYGNIEGNAEESSSGFTVICRYANYYGYDSYDYYNTSDAYYYYRNSDYPSPKVYSLRYWTTDPSITYKFTTAQSSPVISEYLFAPNIDLPENCIIDWGVVRGDSTDPSDLVSIINNRMGILPNRKVSLYYTPDVHQVGLSTVVASQTTNGIIISRVIDSSGNTVTWTDADIVAIKINGYEIDPDIVSYQLIGESGLIQWFDDPRPTTDVITVDITTPGSSHLKNGEFATSDNRRMYYLRNGSWPWDATAIVRVNDVIVNSGFSLYPEDGAVLFFKELNADDIVTVEIQHTNTYRIGYALYNYTNDTVDEPDFSFIFSKEVDTETLSIVSLTAPPIVSNVTLSPNSPSLTDRIVVNYDFYQEDNNAEVGTTIQWYVRRYGEISFVHYSAYDDRNVMRSSDVPADNPTGPFQRYDSWYVIVTPKDVNNTGEAVQSNTINIGGYIPPYIIPTVISSSLSVPATITNDDGDPELTRDDNGVLNAIKQSLIAEYTYYDPNIGDNSSDASIIEWYKNGESEASYSSSYPDIILPITYISTGQVWSYVITPYDGNNYGYKYESEEVIITQSRS